MEGRQKGSNTNEIRYKEVQNKGNVIWQKINIRHNSNRMLELQKNMSIKTVRADRVLSRMK